MTLQLLGLLALAQAGVTRRRAAEARRLASETAAARAERRKRERTIEHEVKEEFREARDKRPKDPRMLRR